MLILTRKKSESVHIGDGISVTVIRVSGNKVRLGVSAPREMRVLRVELDEPVKAETGSIELHAPTGDLKDLGEAA